jgi:TrmH RNA methyltransferase
MKAQTSKRLPRSKPRLQGKSAPLLRRTGASEELTFYGQRAVASIFKFRPNGIIRLYLTEERMGPFSQIMKFCAERKLAYHIVTQDELEKITASKHHEGIAMRATLPAVLNDESLIARMTASKTAGCYIYLDGVGNPHNIGALLRTAAHFGVQGVFGLKNEMQRINPSGARIAEGGAEIVPLGIIEDRRQAFSRARKAGYAIIGSSSHHGKDLFSTDIPHRAVLVMGAEVSGMNPVTAKECDSTFAIPGTGEVESLNVSVAGAILMSEYYRSHRV